MPRNKLGEVIEDVEYTHDLGQDPRVVGIHSNLKVQKVADEIREDSFSDDPDFKKFIKDVNDRERRFRSDRQDRLGNRHHDIEFDHRKVK